MKSKSQLTKADFVRNFPCKKAPRLFWYWKWRGTVKYNPVSVVTVVLFMQFQCWVFRNTSSLSSSFPLWSTSLTSQMTEMIRFAGHYHFPCQCPSNSFCDCCVWWILVYRGWWRFAVCRRLFRFDQILWHHKRLKFVGCCCYYPPC